MFFYQHGLVNERRNTGLHFLDWHRIVSPSRWILLLAHRRCPSTPLQKIADCAQQHLLGLLHLFQGLGKDRVLSSSTGSFSFSCCCPCLFPFPFPLPFPLPFSRPSVVKEYNFLARFAPHSSSSSEFQLVLLAILPSGSVLAHRTCFKVLCVHIFEHVPRVRTFTPDDSAGGNVGPQLCVCPLLINF